PAARGLRALGGGGAPGSPPRAGGGAGRRDIADPARGVAVPRPLRAVAVALLAADALGAYVGACRRGAGLDPAAVVRAAVDLDRESVRCRHPGRPLQRPAWERP